MDFPCREAALLRGGGRRSREGGAPPSWGSAPIKTTEAVRTRSFLWSPGWCSGLVLRKCHLGRGPWRTLSRVRKARKEGGAKEKEKAWMWQRDRESESGVAVRRVRVKKKRELPEERSQAGGREEAALRRQGEQPEALCHRAKARLDEEQEGKGTERSRWVCSGRTVFKGETKPG